jgi:antitoxin component YwqK of YwqJK toxin-antitoxin module
MSKLIDSQEVVFSNKFSNFNSPEYEVLKEVFEKIPMMDTYISNIIEEYIYSTVRHYYEDDSLKREYRTKYGEKDGEYKLWHDNGQLDIQTTYVEGKKHGEYKMWHPTDN